MKIRGKTGFIIVGLLSAMVTLVMFVSTAGAGWRRHAGWTSNVAQTCQNGMVVALGPGKEFDPYDYDADNTVSVVRANGTEEELIIRGISAHGPNETDLPASFTDPQSNLISELFIADFWIIRWEEPSPPLQPGDYVRLWYEGDVEERVNTGGYTSGCTINDDTPAPSLYRYSNADTAAGQSPVCGSPSSLSSIDFPADLQIGDLDVSMSINNIPENGSVYLTSPSGTQIELYNRASSNDSSSLPGPCDSSIGPGYDLSDYRFPATVFNDEGKYSFDWIGDADSESGYIPKEPLSTFDGELSRGSWQLSAAGDVQCWCLDVTGVRTVRFTQDAISVNEDAGEVTVEVELSETSTNTTEVDYFTEPLPGSSQPALSGTLTFPPRSSLNEDARQSFTIPIVDNVQNGPDEALTIRLQNPTNQYSIGNPGQLPIIIRNDDITNDDFDAAIAAGPLLFQDRIGVRSATTAADDPVLPCGSGDQGHGSVWFAVTPTQDTLYSVDTFGSDYDTVLAIWQGARGSLTNIACNDDVQGLQSQISDVLFSGGTTYFIEVAGYSSYLANLSIHITSPAGNDDFDNAKLIETLPFTDTQDITTATIAVDDPLLPCGPGDQGNGSVWYEFTPDSNIVVEVDTFGSNYNTVLAVWQGVTGNLQNVACNDDATGLPQSQLSGVSLSGGTTYYVEIAGYSSDLGFLNLNLSVQLFPPSNDAISSATQILNTDFTDSQDVRGATTAIADPLLPCGSGDEGNGSVWYEFTPDRDTVLEVDTFGSSYDTVLAVWQGAIGNLQNVACNDDATGLLQSQLSGVSLSGGTTYYVEIAGYSSNLGLLNLNLHTTPSNDDILYAKGINEMPYRDSQNIRLATYDSGNDPAQPFPCPATYGGNSVWYYLSSEEEAYIMANTFGSDYDTILTIWTGSNPSILYDIDCNDDATALNEQISGGNQSQILDVHLNAGQRIFIEVTRYGVLANGDMVLNVANYRKPANDDFQDATLITFFPFQDSLNVERATTQTSDPELCGYYREDYASVWYEVTPAQNDLLTVDTYGSTFQPVLGVWHGTQGNLTSIACDDVYNDPYGDTKIEDLPLTGGTTYYIEVAGFYEELGDLEVAIDLANGARMQQINLASGWNLVSSNLQPQHTALASILAGHAGNVRLVKNGAGKVYWPAYNIDQIGTWDVRQGYQIYMNDPATLAIPGMGVDPQSFVIDLSIGWNMIAYLRSGAMYIDQALAGIADDLVLVKDGYGRVYWPEMDINQIGTMFPGRGYQIFMKRATALSYPANPAYQSVSEPAGQRASKPASQPVAGSADQPAHGSKPYADRKPDVIPLDRLKSGPQENPAPKPEPSPMPDAKPDDL